MSDIITTLHPENDESINLYPNIKKENIPNGSVDESKLSESVNNTLEGINTRLSNAIASITQPKYYDISNLPTTDEGLVVGSDGYIYSWNGSAYTSTGIPYQAVQIADGSIDIDKLDNDLQNTLIESIDYTDITSSLTITTGYIITSGVYTSASNCYTTDYLSAEDYNGVYVTGKSQYQTVVIATYDGSQNFLRWRYGNVGATAETFTRIKFKKQSDEVYVRFSSYLGDLKIETGVINYKPDVNEEKINNLLEIDARKPINKTSELMNLNGWIERNDGHFQSDPNSNATDYILIDRNIKYYITGRSQWATCGYATYDANKNFIRSGLQGTNEGNIFVNQEFVPQEGDVYVRFSSYIYNQYQLVYREKIPTIEAVNQLIVNNPLVNKKYVVCGDSFSVGEGVGTNYGKIIAENNFMLLGNRAQSGSYSHYANTSASFLNPSNWFYYQYIPTDADYITIAYGLNEISTTIGDSTSSDNTTIWGAFNEILGWIYGNIPNAKVGIISNDAWMPYELRNALRDIAHYWGVGFLDLKGADVPMFTGGKYSQDGYTPKQSVVDFYNEKYRISSEDSHPNAACYEAKAKVIEAWLKTL